MVAITSGQPVLESKWIVWEDMMWHIGWTEKEWWRAGKDRKIGCKFLKDCSIKDQVRFVPITYRPVSLGYIDTVSILFSASRWKKATEEQSY